MVEPIRRRQRRRAPVALSRQRVIEAALRVADAEGIDAVSMRRLGQELDVEAMSLYKHVADKDAILDGIVDAVFAEVPLPAADVAWRSAMRDRAVAVRQALLRHPWAIGLLDSRRSPGPATLRHHDAVIGSLRRGGFSIEMAAHAFSLLDSYIYGFALQETSLPYAADEVTQAATEMLPGTRPEEYPYLAEMLAGFAQKPGYSYDAEFEFGLDLILDGLARVGGQG